MHLFVLLISLKAPWVQRPCLFYLFVHKEHCLRGAGKTFNSYCPWRNKYINTIKSACNAGAPGSLPGLGRSPGERKGYPLQFSWAPLVAETVKESACNAGGLDLIPGLGRSPGEGKGYPLQFSCLETYMDRGAWRALVHGAAKSQTGLSDFHFHIKSSVLLIFWKICSFDCPFNDLTILERSEFI